MKKSLLAVITLSALLAACHTNNGGTTDTAVSTTDSTVKAGPIAFVHIDSLISKFDMYIDLREAYESKAKKAENQLTSQGRSLERDMMDYQDKVQKGLVTRSQAQALEESLGQKQQNFMQQRERIMTELAEEETVFLNQIHHAITEFLNEYNTDYRYDYILSTSGGSPILSANPAFDITKEVLEGLNRKYAADKGK